jgi:hypothetical protein
LTEGSYLYHRDLAVGNHNGKRCRIALIATLRYVPVVTSGLEAVLEATRSVGGAHDSHAAFRRALRDVLDHGRPTQAGVSLSVAAVGRFVWTMAGSDRLADVEYYDANARRFSDDGVTVPCRTPLAADLRAWPTGTPAAGGPQAT